MIRFHLAIVPPKSTSQTKRLVMVGGRPRFFPKREHQQAQNDLLVLCSPHAPAQPLRGPVVLQVEFTWPWRAGEPKHRRALGRVPMDTRPDLDNCVKGLCDVLTTLQFWTDDGQVSRLEVAKFWGDAPGISVEIREADPLPLFRRQSTATTSSTPFNQPPAAGMPGQQPALL